MNRSRLTVNNALQSIHKMHFKINLQSILKIPSICPGEEKCTILSMVHHRDVKPYLLAIKSFFLFFRPQRIVLIADPSITADDITLLKNHIRNLEVYKANAFRKPGMPTGGTWERLIAISEFVKDDYIIQLDSDTVTLNNITEINKLVKYNHSFTLGTEDNQSFSSATESAQWAKSQLKHNQHVQILAESQLDHFPGVESARYARGCSGFAGFARGSFNQINLGELVDAMKLTIGNNVENWGTEQFASNYIVANTQHAALLPHPKYCHAGKEAPNTVFLHFIGFVRFKTSRYATITKDIFHKARQAV